MPYKIIAFVTIEAMQKLRRQGGVEGWPSRQLPCLPLPAGTPQGTSLQYRPHRQTNLLLTVYPSSTRLGLNLTPYDGFLDQFVITKVANITVLSLTVKFHNDKIVV